MKISELIRELKGLKASLGDKRVVVDKLCSIQGAVGDPTFYSRQLAKKNPRQRHDRLFGVGQKEAGEEVLFIAAKY